MLRLIFGLLGAALVSANSADAHCLPGDNSDMCREFVEQKHGPKPAVPNEVCIFFIQPGPSEVVLKVTPLNTGLPRLYSKMAGPEDRICINRKWLREGAEAYLCGNDEHGGYHYRGEHLAVLAAKPQFDPGEVACLLGRENCHRNGFR